MRSMNATWYQVLHECNLVLRLIRILIHTVAINHNGFMQFGVCDPCFKAVFISTNDVNFDKWCFVC